MTSSPESDQSFFASPHRPSKLNRQDALAYLNRINLPSDLLDAQPSLDLLRKLQSSHMLAVPFESTSVHIKNWHDLEANVELGGGETVPLSERGYKHIVELNRGGYCFLLNGTFPALLRYFGFRVSECLAKVNSTRKDPKEAGVDWEALSHQVSIVDWEGSDGRYLSDVGFGSGPAYPLPLKDGSEMQSIPTTDVYRLTCHTSLPYVSLDLLPDQTLTWMLSRQQASEDPSSPIYIPLYAFQLISTSFRDVVAMNHYQSTHPDAVFRKFFVATILHENGDRTSLSYTQGTVDEEGKRAAKLTRSRMRPEARNDEPFDTKYVEMRVGPIRQVLEEKFKMKFPEDYAGN